MNRNQTAATLGQRRPNLFWTLLCLFVKHGAWLALFILPIEAILVSLTGDIQILGPDPLRLWLAQHVFAWLPPSAATHVVGALTDFKKLVLYFCLGGQLYCTGTLVASTSTDESYQRRKGWVPLRSLTPSLLRDRVGWRRDLWSCLGIIGVMLAFVLFFYRYVRPSTAGHVFGPVGKGLIASNNPFYLSSPIHRVALVSYRAWYIGAMLPLLLTTAYCLPGYLRLTFSSRIPRDIEPDNATTLAALLQSVGIPLVGIPCLALLWTATSALNVGHMAGASGVVAAVALGVMGFWLVMGLVRLSHVSPDRSGFFFWLARVFLRLKALYAVLGVTFLLGAGIGNWLKSQSEAPSLVPAILRAAVQEKCCEFLGWNLVRQRTLIELARVQLLKRFRVPPQEHPGERRLFFEAIGLDSGLSRATDDEVFDYLASHVVVRALLLSLAESAQPTASPSRRWLTENVAMDAQPEDLLRQTWKEVARTSRQGGPLFFDRVWLKWFRWRAVYEILTAFEKRKSPLLSMTQESPARSKLASIARDLERTISKWDSEEQSRP